MKVVQIVAWSCFAVDVLIVVVWFLSSRSSGQDAAGRGMAEAFSILGSIVLAVLGGALYLSTRFSWKPGILIGLVLAALPVLVMALPMVDAARSSLRQVVRVDYEGRFASKTLTEIATAVTAGDTAKIRALAAAGKIDFEARDDDGTDRGVTILGHAVRRFVDREGSLEPVKTLLELGAPPNQGALRVYQPLVFTLLTDGSPRAEEALKVVLDAGADPNVRASDGQASIHSAYNTLPKLKLLAEHGANLNLESERPDERGWTPIMSMAGHSYWPQARFLAEHGVDLDHRAPEAVTLETIVERVSDQDKADPDYIALMEAIRTRRAHAR